MKKFIGLLVVLMFSGCITAQIKDDSEVLSAPSFIIESLADYMVINQADNVDSIVKYCNMILIEEDKKVAEAYIQAGVNILVDQYIDDPFISRRVKSLLNSFDITVDTGDINFDSGSLRTAKDLILIFRDQLLI